MYYAVEASDPKEGALCRCYHCGWTGTPEHVAEIEGADLTPGDEVPAGRCPSEDCGGLVYLDRPLSFTAADEMVKGVMTGLASAIRAKGYTAGTAEIHYRPGGITIWLYSDTDTATGPRAFRDVLGLSRYAICRGDTLTTAVDRAHKRIAEMEPESTEAMRPWFETAPVARTFGEMPAVDYDPPEC